MHVPNTTLSSQEGWVSFWKTGKWSLWTLFITIKGYEPSFIKKLFQSKIPFTKCSLEVTETIWVKKDTLLKKNSLKYSSTIYILETFAIQLPSQYPIQGKKKLVINQCVSTSSLSPSHFKMEGITLSKTYYRITIYTQGCHPVIPHYRKFLRYFRWRRMCQLTQFTCLLSEINIAPWPLIRL